MATPTGMSRSGRVLKKSVKLLEMETETAKTPKPTTQTPTVKAIKISPESLIAVRASTDSLISKSSNIKVNINLPVQEKVETSNQTEPRVPPIIISKLPSTSQTPTVIQVVRNPSNSLILKMKTADNDTATVSTVKRVLESPVLNVTPKKVRAEPESKPATTFKGILSPVEQVDKDTKAKIQQSFATSTPKINTIISSKLILARSIQEQRRINQANRAARMALMEEQPTPITPTRSSQSNENDSGKRRKPTISAYVLWCKENRSQIQSTYPELDFANLSRKMGEIWHTLPQNEKDTWFRKAHLIAKQGFMPTSSGTSSKQLYGVDDLKPKIVSGNLTLPIKADTLETYEDNFSKDEKCVMFENEMHTIGTELIDIQSYLSILGDSLMTIGSYIQRGIKYSSEMDYSLMAALSSFLDSLLVAMSALLCLTSSMPQLKLDKSEMSKVLENVSYLMPPSEL